MVRNFLQVPGQKIHYLEDGTGDHLILLPSLYLTSASYEKIGEVLAKYFHVYIPDIYKGKSVFAHATTSVADYCAALEEFIRGKNIKKYYLVGISASGFVSSYFVRHTKLTPKKLLLFSTTYVPTALGSMNMRLLKGYARLFGHNVRTGIGMKINTRWLTDSIPYFIQHPVQFMGEPRNEYPMENIQDIVCTCETKLVLADRDEFFGDLPIQKINSRVKGLLIDVVHGNHTWFFESPERFVEKIVAACL